MRVNFLGLPLDIISIEDVVERVINAVASRQALLHCSMNALKVVEAHRSATASEMIRQFDLVTSDGMSVVWGLKLTNGTRAEQIAGVDLMARLLSVGSERKWRFFFLGATKRVASLLPERVVLDYPGVIVAGARDGFFGREEEAGVVAAIRESRTDVLLVGMPSPAKEEFLIRNRDHLGVGYGMGVGGGLDLLAGFTRRAPIWMRRCGMEWLFRVAQEPVRLGRRYAVVNAKFAWLLGIEILTGLRAGRARQC